MGVFLAENRKRGCSFYRSVLQKWTKRNSTGVLLKKETLRLVFVSLEIAWKKLRWLCFDGSGFLLKIAKKASAGPTC